MNNLSDEDVGNIVLLEHVNLQVPDQTLATIYYILGLGLTRDPYFNIGVRNMWTNVGEQQFHLPVRPVQVLHGHIALVVPDLDALNERLAEVETPLADTKFRWSVESDHIAGTCPWGNRLRCYAPNAKFGAMALRIPYVEFLVGAGGAASIGRFYDRVLLAPSAVRSDEAGIVAAVKIGRHQTLRFRESSEEAPPYDGHHIAIYVSNFSRPYAYLKERGLVTEDARNHQFRFQQLIDPDSEQKVFRIEHEVRSLHHPMFNRVMVNRNPNESARRYRRGRDALIPYS